MRKQRKPKTQSPIKDRPLPYAGDSALEMMYRHIWMYTAGAVVVSMSVAMMLFFWMLAFGVRPPNPWFITVFLVGIAAIGAYFMRTHYRRSSDILFGIRGERAVAESLLQLTSHGYRVLHDIKLGAKQDSPNIDHVLVGPEGVFVIETKMLRKRIDERQEIGVSGDDILVNGHKLPRSPIAQVRGSLRYITEELGPLARSCPIRGVVVFPGWWTTGGFDGEVWVLNEKAIVTKLKRSSSSAVSDQQRDQIYHLLSKLEKTKLQIA